MEVKALTVKAAGDESAKYPKRGDVRGDIRQILLSAHGVTPATATKQQASNAALQYFNAQVGWYTDRIAFRDYIIKCVKDWLDGAVKG